MISTRDLSDLPDVDALRRLLQSLAMLDAILSPEWEHRYFSFNAAWSPDAQMGSMRNGQGDHFFAHFSSAGCWLKGFDHRSPMTPFAADPPRVAPGMFDGLPAAFAPCLSEPAFVLDETTFCLWRSRDDRAWHHGPVKLPTDKADPDGSARLLHHLDGKPQTYRQWAAGYFGREVPLAAVRSIYAHEPLDPKLVRKLNADVALAELEADVVEIGYPSH